MRDRSLSKLFVELTNDKFSMVTALLKQGLFLISFIMIGVKKDRSIKRVIFLLRSCSETFQMFSKIFNYYVICEKTYHFYLYTNTSAESIIHNRNASLNRCWFANYESHILPSFPSYNRMCIYEKWTNQRNKWSSRLYFILCRKNL